MREDFKNLVIFLLYLVFAVMGEVLILFAAAYVAILIYSGEGASFLFEFSVAYIIVIGILFRFSSGFLKQCLYDNSKHKEFRFKFKK